MTSTGIDIPASYVSLASTAALLVTVLVGLIKPLVELLPGLGPRDAAHDPTLRLLNLALNLAAVFALAAAFGLFADAHNHGVTTALLIIQTFSQSGLSEFTYRVVAPKSNDAAALPPPIAPPTK